MDRTQLKPLPEQAKCRRRKAIIICGSRRSGASALTRVLSLLGASLPKTLFPATDENGRGHWEPAAVRLHDEMLEAAGTHANAVWDAEIDWFVSPAAQGFKARIKDLIAAEYEDAPLFVVKDPRISLLLPLWTAALDEMDIAPAAVVCFRNPIEVAQLLQHRQTSALPHGALPQDKGGLLWLRYTLAAERHSRAIPRAFHAYTDLMPDWRAAALRLGRALEIEWPHWSSEAQNEIETFLDPAVRRHDATPDAASPGAIWEDWIAPVYQELQKAKSGAEPDESLLDNIASSYGAGIRTLGRYLTGVESRNSDLAAEIAAIGEKHATQTRELEQARAEISAQREYGGRVLSKAYAAIAKIQQEREAERAQRQAEGALQERLKAAEERAGAAEAELTRLRGRNHNEIATFLSSKLTKPFRKAHKSLRKRLSGKR
jgi:hypothetical protein